MNLRNRSAGGKARLASKLTRRASRAADTTDGTPFPPGIEDCGVRRDDGQCVYCQARPATVVDHAIPLLQGGVHCRFNLVAACVPCNASKGRKTAEQFVAAFRRLKSFRTLHLTLDA